MVAEGLGGARGRARARGGLSGPAFAVLLAAGCAHPFNAKIQAPPDLAVSLAAVYPFGFRWDEPSYRPYELSQRLVGAAIARAGDDVMIVGPTEFKVLKDDPEHAWVSTNIVSLLPSMQLKPDAAIVVRPWAEKREHSGQKELLDAKGKKIGNTTVQETVFVGHLDVIHPSTGTVLIEMSGEAEVDPFAAGEEDGADPSPELTALMEKMTDAAFKQISKWAKTPFAAPRPLGLTYAFNPKAQYTMAGPGQTPWELDLARKDALEAELFLQTRVKFANPTLTDAQVAKLAKLPGGVWVLTASPGSKLEPGDLVTAVEGQPAAPQALERARFLEIPASVKVRKDNGGLTETIFP